MTVEFSRPVRLDTIGADTRHFDLEANAEECAALVQRFELASLSAFSAQLDVAETDGVIAVQGTLTATLEQICVVTSAPIRIEISEPMRLKFVAPTKTAPDEEIELDNEDCDVVEHDGQMIDLGEAVAQSLVLALDPFPRSTDADAAANKAGLLREEDVGPFAALKALRDKLPGGKI